MTTIILNYDEDTGILTDTKGQTAYLIGAVGVDTPEAKANIIEVLKQGVSPDDLVKLRNGGLV